METQGTEENRPAAVVGRRSSLYGSPGWLIGLALSALSLLVYFGLGSGLRSKLSSEELEDAKTTGGHDMSRPGTSLMKDEISFQRQRQRADERRARAVEQLARQFGQSSVVYLKPGAASDSSGRLNYDHVGQGAGRSIRGVLRPREARKQPNALMLLDREMESALKEPVPTAAVRGGLPPAGKAKDVAPAVGQESLAASIDARKSAGRGDFDSASGGEAGAAAARIEFEPQRQMLVVNRGGIEEGIAASKAVNPEPGMVRETLARTNVPSAGVPQSMGSASSEGGPRGQLQQFQASDAVSQAVKAIELGDSKKSQIAKLTSAQVYGKLGADKGVAHEPRAEMGGIVFDGKRPPEAHVAGLDESKVGDLGGGNLGFSAADKLEGDLERCREAEREAAQAMQTLSMAGKDLRRTLVKEARELQYACFQKWKAWDDCKKSKDKKKNCSPKKTTWVKSQKPVRDKIKQVEGSVGKLTELCNDFDRKSNDKQARCSSLRSESIEYGDQSCQDLVRRPIDDAKLCKVPYEGADCKCF